MQLVDAAKNAKDAGRRAVEEVMDARTRFSPWEISERWLQIAIAQGLHRAVRKSSSPPWRIHDEYPENEITNISSEDPHRIDIVVLHPLPDDEQPWSYCPAIGVIEVKKGWGSLIGDAKRLMRLITSTDQPNDLSAPPPLSWVMLVTLINGADAAAVSENERLAAGQVLQFGLTAVVPCQPAQAQGHSGSAVVIDRWFDVMCYGKSR
jgi:hypothetical protein